MSAKYLVATALGASLLVSGAILGPRIVSAADPAPPPPMSDDDAPGHWGKGGDGRGDHGRFGHDGMRRHGMGQHIDGKLAFLKAELKVQPNQEKAWNAFETALRKQAASMKAKHEAAKDGKRPWELTTPERLDKAESRMNERLDNLRAIKGETKALYAALSADQRKTMDELFGRMRQM